MEPGGIENKALVFEWEDIKKILIVAKAHSLLHFTVLYTLAMTGRRVGEVIGRKAVIGKRGVVPPVPGLRVEDINFSDNQIRWCIEKKFKDKAHQERVYRVKDAQPELIAVLKHWVEINRLAPGQKLFQTHQRTLNNAVHLYAMKAGIYNKMRVCHAFRHGYGLQFAKTMEKASDLVILQEILDHSNTSTTFGYVKMATGETKKAIQRITLNGEND